jgi:hypothetical protein
MAFDDHDDDEELPLSDAAWVGDRRIPTRIVRTYRQMIRQKDGTFEPKAILVLGGIPKPAILNKTCLDFLTKHVSPDPTKWAGTRLEVFNIETSMGDGFRFKLLPPKTAQAAQAAAPVPKQAPWGQDGDPGPTEADMIDEEEPTI